MDKFGQQLESISECLTGLPGMIEEKISKAISDLKPNLLDTDKVKLLIREEIEAAQKETEDAPGGWQEFRKQWLVPIAMMIVSALVSALLTYIVVAGP